MAEDKILKLIDRMEEYIDSRAAGPLSKDKVKVSKEKLFDYTDKLKQALKIEFEEANKITGAKNEILKNAKSKAAKLEAAAEEKLRDIIKDDEIVVAAEKEADYIIETAEVRADEILKDAEDMATQIKLGALSYAEEMLAAVEKMITHSLDTTITGSNSVIDTLKNTLEVVQNNRGELNAQILEAKDNTYIEDGEEEFTVNVNSDDFEDEEDSVSEDDDRVVDDEDDYDEDEEDEEDDDEELFDIGKRFPFKKNDK